MSTLLAVLDAVINTLWQAALITAIVWVVLRFASRVNAATRHAIWWATLLVVLILPAAPGLRRAFQHTANPVTATSAVRSAPAPSIPAEEPVILRITPQPEAKWPRVLFAIWALVLLWRLVQIGRSYIYLRGVKRRAVTALMDPPSIKRFARVLLSSDIKSPMAVGFLHPAIILPESMVGELSETEREHVLLHESAHLAGYDDWANLATRTLAGALALHPVAIWILRQIEREREIACDDWVVAKTGEARSYAKSLAHLVELRHAQRGPVLASGFFGSGSRVGERIDALLRRRIFSSRISSCGITSGMLFLCVLVAASSTTPRWIAFAQPATPEFEVASVKPDSSGERSMRAEPRGIRYTRVTLLQCIAEAYQVRYNQISGHELGTETYDIEAKAAGEITQQVSHVMLQGLLMDRFKLKLHHETRVESVYNLLVGPNGPKLRDSAGEGEGRMVKNGDSLEFRNISMPLFSAVLTGRLGRSVVDQTGINGSFDFALTLDLNGPPDSANVPQSKTASVDWSSSSIFTDIQKQLGLKLEAARAPVDYLVIDHVEKPDAN